MAGENGGGAFIIAYAVAVLIAGLPLLTFEVAIGRRHGKGIVGTLRAIDRRLLAAGMLIACAGFFVLAYYLVVTGWTLGYLITAPGGNEQGFADFAASWRPVVMFAVAALVTFVIVLMGVSRGIERTSKLLMPLLGVIIVGMAAYGMTLSGRGEALRFLFNIDGGALLDPKVWANAFGQAFFSLGVGQGVMLTYGSYLRGRSNLLPSTTAVAGLDGAVALLAGLVVFPVVFTVGFSPASGSDLAFNTLPLVFHRLHAGAVLATAFYLLLFLAAISSSVSILQMTVAALRDFFRWSHARAAWATLAPLLGLGMVSALSYSPLALRLAGKPVLDQFDGAMGDFGLAVMGLLTIYILFWKLGPAEAVDAVSDGPQALLIRAGFFLGRYLAPLGIIAALVTAAYDRIAF